MPTYEYRCETCGETLERHESVAEHEATEPARAFDVWAAVTGAAA